MAGQRFNPAEMINDAEERRHPKMMWTNNNGKKEVKLTTAKTEAHIIERNIVFSFEPKPSSMYRGRSPPFLNLVCVYLF